MYKVKNHEIMFALYSTQYFIDDALLMPFSAIRSPEKEESRSVKHPCK